jgi:hypothetical protein
MIEYNGIQTPCFGTLEEIHTALIKDLNWLNEQVSINGQGYTVKEAGFQDNDNGQVKQILYLALLHPGTAILTGMKEALWHDPSDSFTVVTSGKVPHVSKRCALCGMQLDQEGVTRGACPSCYAEEVSSWTY